jgi:hypothetical protein
VRRSGIGDSSYGASSSGASISASDLTTNVKKSYKTIWSESVFDLSKFIK